MIITCNCGEKKFTLPDNSIPASGRMVQCGFCGLKWKQFPVEQIKKTQSVTRSQKTVASPTVQPKIKKTKNIISKTKETKKSKRKKSGPNLYTPEYLAKKHGLTIGEKSISKSNTIQKGKTVSFGFYNSLIVLIAFFVLFFGVFINSQEYIINYFPTSEIYINYFYETIYNINLIFKNLMSDFLNL